MKIVMQDAEPKEPTYLPQKSRLISLVLYILALLIISKLITGEWFSDESGKRLWMLSGIGLWFFVLISAPWFRPPRDSLANAVTAGLLLSFVDFKGVDILTAELSIFRWVAVGLAGLTAFAAVIAMILRESDPIKQPYKSFFSKVSYRISDSLGRGEIIFTPPALISIIGYYQNALFQQLWLLFFWVFLVSVKPVELVFRLIAQIRLINKNAEKTEFVGTITRVDDPNIIRVSLESPAEWVPGKIVVACLPNSDQVYVLPLFKHVQESRLVGTGLYHNPSETSISDATPGCVYTSPGEIDANKILSELSGMEGGAELIGFVVEDSNISAIRFEVSPIAPLEEGMLIFCRQKKQTIYYQILDARTAEESFEKNPSGKHVVIAAQLGCLDKDKGFIKYGWLPTMNSPVFMPKGPVKYDVTEPKPDEFKIGKVPGSEISIRAGFSDMLEFHSAIIGVTGTGKTEVALDVIRQALTMNTKVFCVDFTGEYKARLSDCDPRPLSLDAKNAEELDKKLFAVDTGEYGAKKEKEALKVFVDSIREPVMKKVEEFLSSEGAGLGIFELPEITNTKATLRATELYLSSIMDWARRNRRARQILIVLEEAHTIIPETIGAGFDSDTQWVVARISQIALQGRKYGVGLLIISQRTALVSKSILSQCNTHITFSLMDKTSLDYLANVYSSQHVKSIPNLRFLEAMVYGKAIRSERPVLIRFEYDQTKKDASEALNKTLPKEEQKES
jgi:hypothetical protein